MRNGTAASRRMCTSSAQAINGKRHLVDCTRVAMALCPHKTYGRGNATHRSTQYGTLDCPRCGNAVDGAFTLVFRRARLLQMNRTSPCDGDLSNLGGACLLSGRSPWLAAACAPTTARQAPATAAAPRMLTARQHCGCGDADVVWLPLRSRASPWPARRPLALLPEDRRPVRSALLSPDWRIVDWCVRSYLRGLWFPRLWQES